MYYTVNPSEHQQTKVLKPRDVSTAVCVYSVRACVHVFVWERTKICACACLCVLVLYMPVGADVHAKKRRQALKDELQNANEFTNPRLPVDAPVSTFKSLPLQKTAVPSTRFLRGRHTSNVLSAVTSDCTA